ncbi:hypothetical protein BSKO_04087 [Bryopsis sp. KO-2023]|nr:hypothetical protein BSKO_04087 [Bryopsis sp. KO-2023]
MGLHGIDGLVHYRWKFYILAHDGTNGGRILHGVRRHSERVGGHVDMLMVIMWEEEAQRYAHLLEAQGEPPMAVSIVSPVVLVQYLEMNR